jgi:hypothetical protein
VQELIAIREIKSTPMSVDDCLAARIECIRLRYEIEITDDWYDKRHEEWLKAVHNYDCSSEAARPRRHRTFARSNL